MFKIIFLLVLTFFIIWCSNKTANVDNKESDDNKKQSIDINLKDNLPIILIKDEIDIDPFSWLNVLKWEKEKIIIYKDKNCDIEFCKEETIINILSWLKLDTNKIEFRETQQEPVYTPAIVIDSKIINSLTWEDKDLINFYFKKVDNFYYWILWNWLNKWENKCNDWIDNNQDWKIDNNDPNCKLIWIIYDNDEELKRFKDTILGFYIEWYKFENSKDILEKIYANINNIKNNIEIELSNCKYKKAILSKPYTPKKEISKTDKPQAYLYVMSRCPFWLQAMKAYVEVMEKLWKYADIRIKYVPYIMHWYEEAVENIYIECSYQYWEKEFYKFMACYLEKWDKEADKCLKDAWIEKEKWKFKECFDDVAKKVNLDNIKNSKERFPPFLYNEEAEQLWVRWSPTFVINWVVIENVNRTARSYAEKICDAFVNPPDICKDLSNFGDKLYDPGYWWTSWWAQTQASCGWN